VLLLVGLWPPRLQFLFAYLLLPSLAQLALLVVLTLLALTPKVLVSWVASGMEEKRVEGEVVGGKEKKEWFSNHGREALCTIRFS
jgi:hypothetical protein